MTQEELDALVEKRLARERKKWEKGAKAPAAAPPAAGAAIDNAAVSGAVGRRMTASVSLPAGAEPADQCGGAPSGQGRVML